MKNHILENLSKNLTYTFEYDDVMDYQCQLEPSYYFMAMNKDFPNVISFNENFERVQLFELIKTKYQSNPDYIWKLEYYYKNEDKLVLSQYLIQIEKELILYADTEDREVKILYTDNILRKKIENLVADVKSCIKEELIKAESKIFLLYESRGLYLRDFEVKKYPIDIAKNYNDDFAPIHELIVERLNTPNDKGIALLHGSPGTGKTSYIRYLTSLINKRMIYIPPEFAHKIASPDFLPLLIDNPNSVLIIEDAEDIISSREKGRNMSVSNLLNVADGLLSDCLSIQILCTFNTNISKIDQALLRKGRLIASYEFKALDIAKAQELSKSIGFKHEVREKMTLAEVYNQKERKFEENGKAKIGFRN